MPPGDDYAVGGRPGSEGEFLQGTVHVLRPAAEQAPRPDTVHVPRPGAVHVPRPAVEHVPRPAAEHVLRPDTVRVLRPDTVHVPRPGGVCGPPPDVSRRRGAARGPAVVYPDPPDCHADGRLREAARSERAPVAATVPAGAGGPAWQSHDPALAGDWSPSAPDSGRAARW